ncbi:MAG: hypothetical protein RR922_04795 [Clostridia bacterium]
MKIKVSKMSLVIIAIICICIMLAPPLIAEISFNIKASNKKAERLKIAEYPTFLALEDCIEKYHEYLQADEFNNMNIICKKDRSKEYYKEFKKKNNISKDKIPRLDKVYIIDKNIYKCEYSLINQEGFAPFNQSSNIAYIELNPQKKSFEILRNEYEVNKNGK